MMSLDNTYDQAELGEFIRRVRQGLPAVVIGTYMGRGTHRLDEWIDERSIILGMKQLTLVVLALQQRATLLGAR